MADERTSGEGGAGAEPPRRAAPDDREQAARLERLGRLAAGVAHDLNNVLTVILSCGHALTRAAELGLPTPADEVRQLVEAGRRASGLTHRLLASTQQQGADPVPPAAATPEPAGGTETILLVEDDPGVRRQALRGLAAAGYQVHVAADGEEALALAATLPQAPDLLLTDVVMPRVDGARLAGMLHARWPGLRVLFTSGYMDERLAPAGDGHFLQKPFTATQLLARVRDALDAPAPGLAPSGTDVGAGRPRVPRSTP